MEGIYRNELNTMQNAFALFASALQDYISGNAEIRAKYNDISQNVALREQRAALNAVRSDAANRISSAAEKLKEHIITVWTPNKALYDRDIVAMLTDGLLSYSGKALENMASSRYADNPTMLQVLRGFVDKNNLIGELSHESPLLYASKEKKLDAAESLKSELLGIIGNTSEAPGHDKSVMYLAENFETVFKGKLDIIGKI